MIFFEDTFGVKRPVSEIRKIAERGVEMKDGTLVQVWEAEIAMALKAARPIIPAAPDTNLLYLCAPSYEQSDKWVLAKQTVVGWRTDEWGTMEPLVATPDDADLPAEYAVEHPSGRISVCGWGADIDAAEDYFEFMCASEKQRRENKDATSAQNDAA